MKKNKRKDKIIAEWGKPKNQHFSFGLIDQYFFFKQEDDAYLLEEKTLDDLDFHDYFKFVDRTNSPIGQQYLYHNLRQVTRNSSTIERQEKRVSFYHSNQSNRLDSQIILSHLSKSTDYYFPFLIFGELPSKMNNYWIVFCLQMLLVICFLLFFIYPIFLIPAILLLGINAGLHYWHKNRIGNFALYFSRLIQLSKTLKSLLPLSNTTAAEKSQHHADIKIVDKITSQALFLKTNDLQESEIATFVWFFFELFKILTLSEIVVFNRLVDQIRSSRKQIENLYLVIGEIDMAIAICSLRDGLPYYAIPNFSTEATKAIEIRGLYHPLIPDCVSNDIHLKNKSLLLTGSNMAGKSTFIKAINLNILTAQTLNTSFSNYYAAPTWRLMTSMAIKDNLKDNSSYYMEEVYSIGRLLKCSEDTDVQYMFTIDEIFKGTNTIERISTAKAILEYLNTNNHLVLVSTHDIELTKLLNNEFDLYYFQENITDQTLSFDYQLKKGILQKSNAIRILELTGYPSEIIEDARMLAIKLANEKTGYSNDLGL